MADSKPAASYRTKLTIVLRVLATFASLVAAISMGISHEDDIMAKDLTSFLCFLVFNAVLSAYSFGVLLLPQKSLLWRTIVIVDMVYTMLLASVDSVTLGMFYLEMHGNDHASWSPICDVVSSYCTRVQVAVVAGFFALGMYFINNLICLCLSLNPLLLPDP
ncbi:hypothetical protein PTKIN_Ptkin03bG0232700 [Pterospermum kingtungense]